MKNILGALALSATLMVPVSASAALQQLTDLFVFGDSLSDGGNSGLLSAAYPAENPSGIVFPPSPYFNGQYSNGPVAVDYLWQAYNPGDTRFKPSLAGGTNYALGGSTSGRENFNSISSSVPASLQPAFAQKSNAWQVQSFLSSTPVFDPTTSLFVVWLFPNDVFNWLQTGQTPGTVAGGPPVAADPAALIANGLTNVASTVAALAGQGAQRFLIPNLPDLGSIPGAGPLGNPALTTLSTAYNTELALLLAALDNLLPATEIIGYDTFGLLNRIRNDPTAYGFEVADRSCVANLASGVCNPGNWDKWLFWDDVHPTTAAHRLLGEQFAATVPEPATLMLLAVALFGAALSGKRKSRE
ncbi:MAG: SGNH/GDSL hydrolase family protein [Candidatus Accumulibacter sp. UW20]|jgi:phospholipase/lecithinase/hemolysin